jgi:AraC-like DNA-binding protein
MTARALRPTDVGINRKRLLPKGSHKLIETLAREGRSLRLIARRLGMSEPTLQRIMREVDAARAAYETGRDEREAALIDQLHNPEKYVPDDITVDGNPGAFAKVVGLKQTAAQTELNSKYGWRFDDQGRGDSGRVTIEFRLPKSLTVDEYRAAIEGQAERVSD